MAGNYNLGTAEGTIRINYDGTGAKKAQVDMDKTSASAKKSSKDLTDVGNASAVAGGVLAAGLAYATNKAISFEKQISAIGAVSGASKADLEALRQKALQLGSDTAYGATEAAQAMEELAKAGVATKDILGGAADATVALAAAGGVELPEAAAIAANAMNQFGLTAQQLPKVVDQIAGAANNSAIDVRDFGFSIAQVGAVAKLAGVSFQDTATAIALMGQQGIKGSDAGTSLKTFLQNLIPTTKQQIELSKELGLITKDGSNAFFDQAGNVKSLADVSQVLKTALAGMTKEQQLNTLGILFGSDAIRASAVLADQGAAGFTNLADALNKTSAADVAAARLDNTAGKIEQLKGQAETAAITVGTILLPGLLNLVSGVAQLANWFNGLSEGTQKTIITVVQVAAAILVLIAVVIKMIAFVKAVQAAWIALNASFLFSPIGLIILAIVALVAIFVILWLKSSAFRNFWISLWNSIWSVLKAIGSWFAGPFASFFVDTWNKIWGFMKSVGAWFAGPFAGFFISIWKTIQPVFAAIGAFFVAIWNGIVAGAQFVWGIISSVIGFFAPFFAATFGLIVDIIKTAWAIISALFQVGLTVWTAIFGAIGTYLSNVWNYAWGLIKGVVLAVWGFIEPFIVGTWNRISSYIQIALQVLSIMWNFIWNGIKAVASAVWGFIEPYIVGTVSRILGYIQSFLSWLSSAWSAIWAVVKGTTSAAWGFIVGVFNSAIGFIFSAIDKVRDILGKIRGFFNQLKEAASGGVGSLIEFVKGIPGKILGALGDVGSMLYNSGVKIIQSLINGFKSKAEAVYDGIKDIMSKARNLLPFSPAKEGPFSGSGWTLYSGEAIAEALAEGINQKAAVAVAATMNLVQQVQATASATSPLLQQFSLQGGFPAFTAPSPRVDLRPQLVVVANFGDGVKEIVDARIVDQPGLVASSANKGNQTRTFLAPGRAL